ncbi:MAG: hypothetical protein J07HQX50_00210 [Haloquadratum sp. J07HQX50]|nr:MAG: hypothetical protein J07HQX50_00210 [Haloquadratum sp. J07HQX50]
MIGIWMFLNPSFENLIESEVPLDSINKSRIEPRSIQVVLGVTRLERNDWMGILSIIKYGVIFIYVLMSLNSTRHLDVQVLIGWSSE